MINKADDYFDDPKKWQKEVNLLRELVLDCNLNEEIKWKQPCYTFEGNNILLIGCFKDYCALLFFKGSLLSNVNNNLVTPTANSQSGRQIRFTDHKEIKKSKSIIQETIFEAIEVEKAGLKVEFKKSTDFDVPEELIIEFEKNLDLKKAFSKLTPGRQKGYYLYFSVAKQSKTRTDRIERYTERILNGKGLRDCVCGASKKMPSCDGSHKYL